MLTQIHAANIECFKQKTNFVEKVRIELTALCLQSNVATLVHAPPLVANHGIEPCFHPYQGCVLTILLIGNLLT